MDMLVLKKKFLQLPYRIIILQITIQSVLFLTRKEQKLFSYLHQMKPQITRTNLTSNACHRKFWINKQHVSRSLLCLIILKPNSHKWFGVYTQPHSPNDIFTNQHNNQPPLPYNNNLNRFTIKQSFTQTFIATTTPPSPLQHTRFWLGDKLSKPQHYTLGHGRDKPSIFHLFRSA